MDVAPVVPKVSLFYDGGLPPTPEHPDGQRPDRSREPRIVLVRHAGEPTGDDTAKDTVRSAEERAETFSLERRIAYADRQLGELLVPADVRGWRTDLTSVPGVFTWLVPKTGAHLPAALLHDGLVHGPREAPSYVSTEGHTVLRVEAGRIFRDAMADTGTGVVRRWLVWSAVTTWTLIQGTGTGWSAAMRSYYRCVAVATVLAIVYLGYCATFDLVDRSGPVTFALPWMGDRVWWLEVLGGLAGAIVVPLLLCLWWGPFRIAGAVAGLVLAVLLHVTAGIVVITLGYQATEWLARKSPTLATSVAAVAVAGSVLVVVLMWAEIL